MLTFADITADTVREPNRYDRGFGGLVKTTIGSTLSWCKSAAFTTRFRWNVPFLAAIVSTLVAVPLLSVVSLTEAHAGTKCDCKRHNAEAEASGTCSRTEDDSYCTLKFSATPRAYRRVFADFLQQVESEVRWQTNQDFRISDVDAALNFSWRTPPFDWEAPHIRQYLPVLFAISQRETISDDRRPGLSDHNYRFRQTTFDVTTFIVESTDAILQGWQDRDTMSDRAIAIELHNRVRATVSYGCIQVNLEGVETMVKTAFSLGGYGCTDTDPELYDLD